MYVHVCARALVCGCACMCVHMCMEAKGQPQALLLSRRHPPVCLETGSLTGLELLKWALCAGQRAPRICVCVSPRLDCKHTTTPYFFSLGSGDSHSARQVLTDWAISQPCFHVSENLHLRLCHRILPRTGSKFSLFRFLVLIKIRCLTSKYSSCWRAVSRQD